MTASLLRRLGLGALVAVALALVAPGLAAAQDVTARFEITMASDSTFTFPTGKASWVKRGQQGVAVDPRRRDMLVARFKVLQVQNGVATALVTGQTTDVSVQHVAVLDRPPRHFYAQSSFWLGLAAGAGIGVAVTR